MYDDLKNFQNKIYSGMKIGDSHSWHYSNGKWYETKKTPDEWNIHFECLKTRTNSTPLNSGAKIGTKYHWYILADQFATKLDPNSYMTIMKGVKFKIGHKRPHWKKFSYEYPQQLSYKERIIKILEDTLEKLKNSSSC